MSKIKFPSKAELQMNSKQILQGLDEKGSVPEGELLRWIGFIFSRRNKSLHFYDYILNIVASRAARNEN